MEQAAGHVPEGAKKPYQIHISQFEGPLDLLLHLIEKAEVDIKDIFVSEITAQYLAYMEDIEYLDMDMASEFLNMAANLVYIKSRQLLPRPPKEEMEEEDPEILLIRQLREYQAFKKASVEMETLYRASAGSYTRLPEEYVLPDQEYSLSGATMQELYRTFFTMLHAQQEVQRPHPLHHVRADLFTVRMQINKVRTLLLNREEMAFGELFGAHPHRMEVIVTFMALMELIGRGEIVLRQTQPFAPIYLMAGASLGSDDSDTEYMDEYTE